jgi:hypothetical protein
MGDLQKKSFRTSAGTVEKVRWIHSEYWNVDNSCKDVFGSHAGQRAILPYCMYGNSEKKIKWQDSYILENVDIPCLFQEIYL